MSGKQYVIELGDNRPEGMPVLVGPFADPTDAVLWAASQEVLLNAFRLTELAEPWTVESVAG